MLCTDSRARPFGLWPQEPPKPNPRFLLGLVAPLETSASYGPTVVLAFLVLQHLFLTHGRAGGWSASCDILLAAQPVITHLLFVSLELPVLDTWRRRNCTTCDLCGGFFHFASWFLACGRHRLSRDSFFSWQTHIAVCGDHRWLIHLPTGGHSGGFHFLAIWP